MIHDALEHQGAPHLAGTVERKRRFEQPGIRADHLRIRIVGQLEHALYGSADLLGLDGANDVHRREVMPVSLGMAQLAKREDDAQNDREQRLRR